MLALMCLHMCNTYTYVSVGLGEARGSGHRVCKGHRQDTAELSNEDEATRE